MGRGESDQPDRSPVLRRLTMNPAASASRRPLATPPAPASPFPYHSGSLLSILDLTVDGVSHLLRRATDLENEDPIVRDHILAKRRIALLFYESSTRTRTSFELASKALGADTTLVSSLSSSIEKGESLKDTGLTLRALGAEAIILRHSSSGAAWLLEEATRLPVIERGRRHARASHAGAAGPADDPRAPAAWGERGWAGDAGRSNGNDRR